MEGQMRRDTIIKMLGEKGKPLSGTELAKELGVSRQVIVQDIALLRAVNKNIFIEQIKYNYSGQLPAEAQIRIFVGTRYAGKTLYYSRLFDNGTILNIDAGVVDSEGYLTVKQNHCSTYLITTEKLADTAATGNGGTTSGNGGTTSGSDSTASGGAAGTAANASTTANSQPTVKTSGKPKTGDNSAIAVCMTLLAAGCGGMFVFRRKKSN